MCEAEPYFADLVYVIGELEEAGALTEDQAFTFDQTLQNLGARLAILEEAIKYINDSGEGAY